jgi:hypothetical protein
MKKGIVVFLKANASFPFLSDSQYKTMFSEYLSGVRIFRIQNLVILSLSNAKAVPRGVRAREEAIYAGTS